MLRTPSEVAFPRAAIGADSAGPAPSSSPLSAAKVGFLVAGGVGTYMLVKGSVLAGIGLMGLGLFGGGLYEKFTER